MVLPVFLVAGGVVELAVLLVRLALVVARAVLAAVALPVTSV